ncbi:GNAT superfamily N-acetyltransferase [Cellulosimicrobium cellulans]|uniref:GNAT family N-acetyltransferase n=1 Tax=Cellulosimicrobium cellulans TaxID=1710 RepID=UPI00195CEAB5|nr:GNAT family N-acetyltransferase [Cellulosimicrobium cellulans]MBM7821441.1 GNAT superfamily N-acetyltransferase [Cellulosimicrobium cellulans]
MTAPQTGPTTRPAPPTAVGPRVRVEPVAVPASLDAPDAWGVHGTVRVGDAIDRAIYGHTDLALDAATVAGSMASTGYRRVLRWVAVLDDAPHGTTPRPEDVVGRSMVALPQQGNTHVAVVYVGVDPDHRRRGVGAALWDAALEVARTEGRRVVLSDSSFAPEPPPGPDALEAPTGSGRVPAHDEATVFALRRGFTLEQVLRHSVLDLPVAPDVLDPLRATATERADGYRVHVWTDEVPEEWIDQFATLETRMSTDAPSGGLDLAEDPWDAERVRTASREIHARGQGYVIAAAEHAASGTLAAFSMVAYPHDRPEVVFQEDTLVLREHRGRSLGMLVKVAVLDELARARPSSRRVHTWNAQENAHMLAINVALGFAPASVDAEWQLVLDAPPGPEPGPQPGREPGATP